MKDFVFMSKENNRLVFIKSESYDLAISKLGTNGLFSDYGLSTLVKLHEYDLDDNSDVQVNRSRLCYYYQKMYNLNNVIFR